MRFDFQIESGCCLETIGNIVSASVREHIVHLLLARNAAVAASAAPAAAALHLIDDAADYGGASGNVLG